MADIHISPVNSNLSSRHTSSPLNFERKETSNKVSSLTFDEEKLNSIMNQNDKFSQDKLDIQK